MKKGLVLIIAVLLITIPAIMASVSVTLTTPTGSQSSPNITFTCVGSVTNATEDGNLGANAQLLLDSSSPSTTINKTNASISGTSYTATFAVENLANGNYYWNCRFFNSTSDNSVNATAASEGTFSVSYSAPVVNNAPNFTGTILNQSFAEDSSLSNAFDLDSYFADASAMTYSASGNSSITITISDGQVSFSSTGNISVNETIYFTASDGTLTNRSNNILVTVYSVNDAPYLKSQIPNQNMTKNTNHTITLSTYFGDAESDALNYSASTAPSNINVTISGSTATLVPAANWTGTATIVFAANDSKNSTNSNTITLNVSSSTSGNSAPSITEYSPSSDTVTMDSQASRTFSIVKSDPNGDTLTVKWYLDDQEISGATGDSYQISKPSNGTHTLKVIVADANLSAQRAWTLQVTEAVKLNFATPTVVETPSIIPKAETPKPVCGNGVIEAGEDCATCIEDAKCADNEVCINSKCEKKKDSSSIIAIVMIIAGIIGIIIFILYKLNASRHTYEEPNRDSPRKPVLSNVELKPASEIKDFYHNKQNPPAKSNPLAKDIEELRKSGVTDQDIISKLKAKGWPQWKIEMKLKGK